MPLPLPFPFPLPFPLPLELLLEELELDSAMRAGLSAYLPVALAHLEQHELAHLSPLPAPRAAQALGACDGALAREIFHDTVRQVILPGLERLGLSPSAVGRALVA